MKRRSTLIIVSLVAAFTLLAVTAFASAPNYAGYEAFKALSSAHNNNSFEDEENGTIKGSITVKDNGVTLLDLDANFKADGPSEALSGTFTIEAAGVDKSIEIYAQDETVYIFDEVNNEYYQVEKGDEFEDENYDEFDTKGYRGNDGDMSSAQEELLDFIVGDLKDDFELTTHSDGSETIAFELTKDEMPMLLNLMFSAMDHDRGEFTQDEDKDMDPAILAKYPLLNDLKNIEVDMPEITENMELDYLRFAITTDKEENFLAVDFSIIVTGDDELGISHTQQVDGKFIATEVGTTVVDSPELDGKNIIVVDKEDFNSDEYSGHMKAKGRR